MVNTGEVEEEQMEGEGMEEVAQGEREGEEKERSEVMSTCSDLDHIELFLGGPCIRGSCDLFLSGAVCEKQEKNTEREMEG